MSATGTEGEVPFNLPTAPRASPAGFILGRTGTGLTCFIENAAAAIAFEKALPPLDRDQGNEKQTDIVVQPLEAGRRQAATGADPRLFIHFYSSGLNSTDENEGASPPNVEDSIEHGA